jgi:hypothetical protein
MSDSLRRSGRRSAKTTSSYNVGDIVEVSLKSVYLPWVNSHFWHFHLCYTNRDTFSFHATLENLTNVANSSQVARHDAIVRGRLVYRLSEGPTANPRWLVAFDDEPSWKDEELYEKFFGKTLTTTEAAPPPKLSQPRNKADSLRKKTAKPNNGSIKTSSSSEAEESRSGRKKSVTFTDTTSPNLSEADSSPKDSESKSDLVSAREQRSLRRQAKVEEEIVHQHKIDPRKRPVPVPAVGIDQKRLRGDEEVIKVPMLTGTLYLYRGPVRRAEFVRRF